MALDDALNPDLQAALTEMETLIRGLQQEDDPEN